MSGPAVTVVLPTFRRPDALARALSSIAAQDDPGIEWELLVIDNDDGPGAGSVVHALSTTIPASVTLLREPKRGAAYARNTGIEAAKGDVVAFVDDDVSVASGWLRALTRPILDGRSEGAGGPVVLDPAVALPHWVSRDWRGCLSEYSRGDAEKELPAGDFVLTASAAFRTDLLRQTGGFDPVLGPAQRVPIFFNEDVDLCRRFWGVGGRIRYIPEAAVTHEVPPSRLRPGYFVKRTYAQGRSDWLLDRETNARRPLGGAKGILIHLERLLSDRAKEGPWHADVAMGAALSVVHTAGFLREAAVNRARAIREARR
ncbi:MAG: glycosyltransferase [Acidimicrobiia bacterium]|nr:glycosyltransferase [Acidimicrobiia bacterium]